MWNRANNLRSRIRLRVSAGVRVSRSSDSPIFYLAAPQKFAQKHIVHTAAFVAPRKSDNSHNAKKTNEWVLNKAAVMRGLLDIVKARKLACAYYSYTMRKQGSCLEKEMMQGTVTVARRRGRPRTAWMDNIKTWTGLSVEESIRMTEDRDKWRKYVHGVANPRIEEG